MIAFQRRHARARLIQQEVILFTEDQHIATTARERAVRVIDSDHIRLDPKLSIFVVKSTSEARVVHLFPKQSCSCPAKTHCYHMQAARMAVGLQEEYERRLINLTQLLKNKRKRGDKTSGRKRPRRGRHSCR